jgi:hypothetical protein
MNRERTKISSKYPLVDWFMKRLLLFLLFIPATTQLYAQSSLLVIPRRVVFEGNGRRTQELNLANGGNDTVRYSISIIDVRMKQDGTFEEIVTPDSGQNFASSHLRIFPRHVILGPDEAQSVKVQLTNTGKMEPGEYRSHIYFKALAPDRPATAKKMTKMVTNLKLRMKPMFGVTIPVIIKLGENTTHVTISDLSFDIVGDTMPKITGVLNRTGNMSAYGNISIEHISPEGNHTHVATVKGLAVYAPVGSRKFTIQLSRNFAVNYKKGKLNVMFTTEVEDRQVKIAEETLLIR